MRTGLPVRRGSSRLHLTAVLPVDHAPWQGSTSTWSSRPRLSPPSQPVQPRAGRQYRMVTARMLRSVKEAKRGLNRKGVRRPDWAGVNGLVHCARLYQPGLGLGKLEVTPNHSDRTSGTAVQRSAWRDVGPPERAPLPHSRGTERTGGSRSPMEPRITCPAGRQWRISSPSGGRPIEPHHGWMCGGPCSAGRRSAPALASQFPQRRGDRLAHSAKRGRQAGYL